MGNGKVYRKMSGNGYKKLRREVSEEFDRNVDSGGFARGQDESAKK